MPAWWGDAADKRKQNRRSARQERERATKTGGHVQPGSGSSYRAPQDVITPLDTDERGYVESIKYTDSDGFRIDAREWAKLRADALRSGREPRLVIDFTKRQTRLVIIEEDYPRRGA